jgi:thioesterase domain-containing protein/acyl carrier protein
VAVYDVTLSDEHGRVVADIRDFAMVRVQDKALLARDGAAPAVAPARAVANPLLAIGLKEGIRPDEGLELIERVLAWRPGPQVTASPHDVEVLLARLRAGESPPEAAPAKDEADDPNWRAPATPMEKLIAHMWAELLGQERVSATGNFFDLGGHSLLAVQVINRLRKRTGKPLPLTALLQAPTVESLAALIEPPGEQAAEAVSAAGQGAGGTQRRAPSLPPTVVPIRPGADGPALFFVHDGKGETLLYRTLALSLDAGWPIYGLQPFQHEDGSFAHTRIAEMAAFHVEQVRAVQPQGPYFLTGLCAGGVIAFEMARQLQDAGQSTAFVGIIDAADVHAEERPFRLVKERWQRFMATLGDDASRPLPARVGHALPRMLNKAGNAIRWEIHSRLARRRQAQQVQALRDAQAGERPAEGASPIEFLPLYEHAHRQHQPRGQFQGGDVVLFRATRGDGSVADRPYVEIYSDPLLGWQPRVVEPVIPRDVPGGHSSALQEPNVRVLADAMRESLRTARARHVAARATAQAATTSLAGVPTVSPSPSLRSQSHVE